MNEETEFPIGPEGIMNDVFSSGEIPMGAEGVHDSEAQASVGGGGAVQLIVILTD